MVVDAALELPEISNERSDGGRYVGAWVIVQRGGVPCGTVELGFGSDGKVDPAQLRRLVAALPPPAPQDESVPLPSMSVVIASNLARPGSLLPTLASLSRSTYPDLEIIVVDNRRVGGAAPLPDILAAYPQVRWMHEPRPGADAARNIGIAEAKGEIVALTDDDVEVSELWLHAIGRRFAAHPEEDAVAGLILPLELETAAQVWFERYYGGFAAKRQYEPMSYASATGPDGRRKPWSVVATNDRSEVVRTFPVYGAGAIGAGANMAFRKAAIMRIDGFDPALGIGTPARGGGDIAAFMTLLWEGGRIGFEPAAAVFHQHRPTETALRRQLHNYGIGYVAILMALIHRDRRHAAGIARQLPAAIARYVHAGRGSPDTTDASGSVAHARAFPRYLRVIELAGTLRGPTKYVASLREARRWGD